MTVLLGTSMATSVATRGRASISTGHGFVTIGTRWSASKAWINNLPYSPIFDRGIIREKYWLPGKVFGNHKLYLLLLVSKLSELPIALYYSSPLPITFSLKC